MTAIIILLIFMIIIGVFQNDYSLITGLGKIVVYGAVILGILFILATIADSSVLSILFIMGVVAFLIYEFGWKKKQSSQESNAAINNFTTKLEENKTAIQSDFQKELQQNTKTPEEVADESWLKEKEQISNEANRDYEYMKQELLNKARSGQYSVIGNQKCISINYYCGYLLKCVNRQYNYRPTEKAYYNISKTKQYNLYLNTITQLASEDNIDVVPFFAEVNIIKNSERRIDLPYTYTYKYGQSVATHKIKSYLECSIHY